VMEQEKPRTLTFNLNNDPKYDSGLVCGGTLDIFIEPVVPAAELYIFGAGHISLSLAKAARLAGFEITVVDDRESYANLHRFPEAKAVHAEDYDAVLPKLNPGENAYLVIVTRGHRDDMRVLRWAVRTRAKYIGMIGSQRKVLSIYKELQKEGVARGALERVHAPVGLAIGAILPEEIAISIVAELIAVKRNSEGELPRMRVQQEKILRALGE
jgi:xanthine dehydrogenase accessory factor